MKKLLLHIIAAAVFTLGFATVNAQTTSTFENLTLSPNSDWNGSVQPLGNSFLSGNAYFTNFYDTAYGGFWAAGFSYSNMTDSVTSGSGNQYSAKTASGYASSTYVVGQVDVYDSRYPVIRLTGNATGKAVNGFYVTNATYTYNSMRDGDNIAKKFGGTSGNDPDWLKLIIHKWLDGVKSTDSVEFYLADFRFSDNSQDYLVKDWRWVDLTSLGNADSLLFTMASSDAGQFGINTPLFFCIDNFTTNDFPAGIESMKSNNSFSVYPVPTTNFVQVNAAGFNGKNLLVSLTDVSGRVIFSKSRVATDIFSIDISGYDDGVYFLTIKGEDSTVTKKIIKE